MMTKVLDWRFYDDNLNSYDTQIFEVISSEGTSFRVKPINDNSIAEFDIKMNCGIDDKWTICDKRIARHFSRDLSVLDRYLTELCYVLGQYLV